MASRNFAQLVCRLSSLSFRRGAIQRNTLQNVFPLSRNNVENTVLRKTIHLSSPVWRKHAQFIDRSTTSQDENSDGSDGSWRSWRAPGTLLMVGDVLYNSEDINKQNESSPGTSAEASGTEGRRREVRDARGRFARKSEKSRSGFKRTQGIREWRAKRKLEFDENDPPNVLETRARKVRRADFELQEI